MELQFPSFPLCLSFLLIFFLVLTKKRNKSKTQNPNAPLPPGPWKLPIIGSMHHLIGARPHHVLCSLSKRYGPVMHLKLGEIDLIAISSSEAAREVMKINDLNFASRPELLLPKIVCYGGTDIAFSPCGDYWRQLRKICVLELLTAKRVKTFSSLREEEISNLIRYISSNSGSPVNLTERFLSLVNTVTARAAFGEKCRQQERFITLMKEGLKLIYGFNIVDLYPSLKFLHVVTGIKFKLGSIHRQVDEIVDEIIREHQTKNAAKEYEEEKQDLLDVLLRIREHGDLEMPLTMSNIKAVILDMFTAGTETSSTLMEWAMAELMRNPKVMEKAQAEVRRVLSGKEKIEESDVGELKYLKLVIKETLRLRPPLPILMPRVCGETCEVGGYTIPAGSRVIINAWAMGRDPIYWDDAESFRPERFAESGVDYKGASFEYVPFGAGRRICPGIAFGLANVELALAQLLFYFDWALPDGIAATVGKGSELWLLARPHVIAS